MHRSASPKQVLLGSALLCVGLAACGGGGSGNAGGPGGPPAAPGPPSISFNPAEANFTTDRAQPTAPSRLSLRLQNATVNELFISGDYTTHATTRVDVELLDTTTIPLIIHHRPASTLYNGTYTDRLTFHACLDQACTRPLAGSPLNITINFSVTGTDPATGETGPPPDPAAAVLPVRSRIVLSHDVRDAEYSRSLDRIVMAASYPDNALYVYDANAGTEASMPLPGRPDSVSISPDGLTAAIGHGARISIVDLTQVGQGSTPVAVLNVSANVFETVLDGRGRVHAIPDTDRPASIHTIDIATGFEQLSSDPGLYGQTYARLQPYGDFLFVGDPLTSPANMDKWDITGSAAEYVTSARFDMAYIGACGNVWFNESGTRVHSQCGQVFHTDGPPNTDLSRIGRLELSGPETTTDAFTIAWMDEFASRNEIALIEANAFWCRLPVFGIVCYHRLGVFDNSLLTRSSLHALAPIEVNGTRHAQHGLFVFYRSDGTSKLLLSRLDAMSNPDSEYYLSVLD